MRRVALALSLFLPAVSLAADPSITIVQTGRLLEANDAPVTAQVSLKVRLWDGDEARAAEKWSETYSVKPSPQGIYSIVLGDTFGSKRALTVADFDGPRWLSVSIGDNEFLPRMAFSITPYAARATNADKFGGLTLTELDARYDTKFDAKYAPASGAAGYVQLSPTLSQGGAITITGDVTAAKFKGDGSLLTGIKAENVSGAFNGTFTGSFAGDGSQITGLKGENVSGTFTGTHVGDGSGLTGIKAESVTGQLSNIRLPAAASAPTCNAQNGGGIYFNTTDLKVYVCNGTAWKTTGGGGARFTFGAASVAFGNVGPGPSTKTVQLTNAGDAEALGVVVEGLGAGFDVTSDCAATIAAGASCTVSATFQAQPPQGARAGVINAFASNAGVSRIPMTGSYDAGAYGNGADGDVLIQQVLNMNAQNASASTDKNGGYADGIAIRVSASPSGTTVQTLESATDRFVAGDKAIVINLQGTDTDNSDAGSFELVEIASVSGNTVTLAKALTKTFAGQNFANQKVVLQRVPQYRNVTIATGGTLTAGAWDGLTATPSGSFGYQTGIVAFLASGTLSVGGGGIDVSKKGFRGMSATQFPESFKGTTVTGGGGGGGGYGGWTNTCCDNLGRGGWARSGNNGLTATNGPDYVLRPGGSGGNGAGAGGASRQLGGTNGADGTGNGGASGTGGGGGGGAKAYDAGAQLSIVTGKLALGGGSACGGGGGGGGGANNSGQGASGGGSGGTPSDFGLGAGYANSGGGGGGGGSPECAGLKTGYAGSNNGNGAFYGTEAGATGTPGQAGGGAILIWAKALTIGGPVVASGGNGGNGGKGGKGGYYSDGSTTHPGGGGGGGFGADGAGGGSIFLRYGTASGTVNPVADGGAGGSAGAGGLKGAVYSVPAYDGGSGGPGAPGKVGYLSVQQF